MILLVLDAHPDKFDADLELVKVFLELDLNDKAEEALQRVTNRGGRSDINVLKAHTAHLFKTEQIDKGAIMLKQYKQVWAQAKQDAQQLRAPLTTTQQAARKMPYGHGIGIAYYHTVLDQDQLSEQTLSS